MKIAFWGLGSIAKRHIRNIDTVLSLRGIKREIDVFRHSSRTIDDAGISKFVSKVYLEEEMEDKRYDSIFITNPTALHYEAIKTCVSHAKNLFIEKPVFDRWDVSVESLELEQGGIYYIACPLRYSSVLQYVKNHIELKRVFAVQAISSSYLPDWRPGQDYRDTYSAHKNMGGGVSVDLIHEWDYLTALFGMPEKVMYAGGKYSGLEIDSDDIAAYIGVYQDKLVELHLDYFGRKTVRKLVMYTPEETIQADLVNSCVHYLKAGKVIDLREDRNTYQIREIEHFLDIVDGKCENDSTIEHGLQVLRLTQGII